MAKYLKFIIPIGLLITASFVAILVVPKWQRPQTVSSVPVADGSLQDFYNEAQQLTGASQTAATTTTTFLAVGDIMLSRDVAATTIKAADVDYPFANVADLLKSTDFNFANLESPVAAPGTVPIVGGNSLTFGAPSSSLVALKSYNFQIINSANNHAFDQGVAGLSYTRSILDNLGIAHEGTGQNLNQAWTPAVVTANGIKICFVGAAYGTNSGGSTAAQYVAEISETDMLKQAINTAKAECDFVVVTMHAGTEYTRTPNQGQIDFAHAAIDDGANMVIGAHPHWIQPIEKYNGKYIFYSLGNFIFDQAFSPDVMQGLTLKITISKPAGTKLQGSAQAASLLSVQLIPVIIQNSQPRQATSEETKNVLNKIGITSNTLH
jgi:poly-gamma-glutamate synthesis protein (capsule biosynthesis protein)